MAFPKYVYGIESIQVIIIISWINKTL